MADGSAGIVLEDCVEAAVAWTHVDAPSCGAWDAADAAADSDGALMFVIMILLCF